jgi:Response regulator containing a CheY-like receiver domain and an HTH DNA-binding domain
MTRKICRTEVLELYASGLSTRQVASKLGISKSHVHKICRPITRERRDALLLRLPPPKDTKHWRTCRQRARRVVEKHLGRKLDQFEYVHHIDEDFTNNDISNLEVLSPLAHSHRHRPPNPIPRHLRPERKAYMREYLKNYRRPNESA